MQIPGKLTQIGESRQVQMKFPLKASINQREDQEVSPNMFCYLVLYKMLSSEKSEKKNLCSLLWDPHVNRLVFAFQCFFQFMSISSIY